ncbi:hypothetical protein BN946_scf184610.g1 [Trametes cinnabarina]|uniref:Tc1-like transposase DDE domain-containing protein n=1 Tax=Pycnoporus cinnabarinus TaxID=5643 RepID=A0A060T096_PYCCI|nr:hypothetical protein BN946_scf184610.g1 [Trametes cinnabarina]
MARGRPPKRKRVTSGLRNHRSVLARTSPDEPEHPKHPGGSAAEDPDEPIDAEDDSERNLLLEDSLKPRPELAKDSDTEESDVDEESEWEELESEDVLASFVEASRRLEGGLSDDEEWLPATQLRNMRKDAARKRDRPQEYKKGPDIGSKAPCTQRRYRRLLQGQTNLNAFVTFTARETNRQSSPGVSESGDGNVGLEAEVGVEAARMASLSQEAASSDSPAEFTPPAEGRAASLGSADSNAGAVTDGDGNEEDGWESEEDNLEEMGGGAEIRGWKELREQVKVDLKKKSPPLSLAQTNQLIIIRNFATLRLKGFGRITASQEIARQWHEGEGTHLARCVRALARHYQVFEQLPIEKRGGKRESRSHLYDESVRRSARAWLTSQPNGEVTPKRFQDALNTTILPSLGIELRTPLSVRTARRWLIKLGWRHVTLRKGVYMDGHERKDVVQYRNNVFLPRMAEFEARMDHYDGPDLALTPADLCPGEKKVIALFHDECCFHVNDYKRSAWLPEGATILQKKGKGRLIHVSDFITAVSGRLVLLDANGEIVEDARKIIFPGSNGDPWWDMAQLIEQVKRAITIFERAHPGCTALFVFDQSSAHAALSPIALRPFEMNKTNGGRQRKQCDTIIPMSNPDPDVRGQPQKMTLENGQAKGLQQVLTERGFTDLHKLRAKCSPVCPFESTGCCMARLFSQQDDVKNQESMLEMVIKEAGHECIFLPKFHCELNPIEMYWGWCKYRYREVVKKNFEDAKRVAVAALDSCPIATIRRFINKSWRFMSAYRQGLTGAAAAWAVRKQKQHRQVSRAAMMALDAVVN